MDEIRYVNTLQNYCPSAVNSLIILGVFDFIFLPVKNVLSHIHKKIICNLLLKYYNIFVQYKFCSNIFFVRHACRFLNLLIPMIL